MVREVVDAVAAARKLSGRAALAEALLVDEGEGQKGKWNLIGCVAVEYLAGYPEVGWLASYIYGGKLQVLGTPGVWFSWWFVAAQAWAKQTGQMCETANGRSGRKVSGCSFRMQARQPKSSPTLAIQAHGFASSCFSPAFRHMLLLPWPSCLRYFRSFGWLFSDVLCRDRAYKRTSMQLVLCLAKTRPVVLC